LTLCPTSSKPGVIFKIGPQPHTIALPITNKKEITMKKLTLAALPLILAACSHAGPFVTNVSSDGANGLNIEKCLVEHNSFTGTVSTSNCTSQKVQLSRQ
jgi:hypothetical protein